MGSVYYDVTSYIRCVATSTGGLPQVELQPSRLLWLGRFARPDPAAWALCCTFIW